MCNSHPLNAIVDAYILYVSSGARGIQFNMNLHLHIIHQDLMVERGSNEGSGESVMLAGIIVARHCH